MTWKCLPKWHTMAFYPIDVILTLKYPSLNSMMQHVKEVTWMPICTYLHIESLDWSLKIGKFSLVKSISIGSWILHQAKCELYSKQISMDEKSTWNSIRQMRIISFRS